VLQGIFVAEKQCWRKLYNNYLHDFYSSSYCDQIKEDEVSGTCNVQRGGEYMKYVQNCR
jgi:hypothetical protein